MPDKFVTICGLFYFICYTWSYILYCMHVKTFKKILSNISNQSCIYFAKETKIIEQILLDLVLKCSIKMYLDIDDIRIKTMF